MGKHLAKEEVFACGQIASFLKDFSRYSMLACPLQLFHFGTHSRDSPPQRMAMQQISDFLICFIGVKGRICALTVGARILPFVFSSHGWEIGFLQFGYRHVKKMASVQRGAASLALGFQ